MKGLLRLFVEKFLVNKRDYISSQALPDYDRAVSYFPWRTGDEEPADNELFVMPFGGYLTVSFEGALTTGQVCRIGEVGSLCSSISDDAFFYRTWIIAPKGKAIAINGNASKGIVIHCVPFKGTKI